jgi:lysophospholipase L1-like esterase
MGDSIDFGIGATSPDKAYVALFGKHLESTVFQASSDLHNLATPGATARDIKQDQLARAESELVAHRPRVVSWGGGGNDLLDFINSPQAATCLRGNLSCLARLNALLNELERTIDRTLREIREVAGDHPVYVRTQYNALLKSTCGGPGLPLAQLASAVLEGSPSVRLERGLNTRIRELAAKYQAKVIDIFVPFYLHPDDYIAADCAHPTDQGHYAIFTAATFAH